MNVPAANRSKSNWQFTTRGWLLAIIWLAFGLITGQLLYGSGHRYVGCCIVVGGFAASLWSIGLSRNSTYTAALIGFFLITPVGSDTIHGALFEFIWASIFVSDLRRDAFILVLLISPGVALAIIEALTRFHFWRVALGYSTVIWLSALWTWIWMMSDFPPALNLMSLPFVAVCIVKVWSTTNATGASQNN